MKFKITALLVLLCIFFASYMAQAQQNRSSVSQNNFAEIAHEAFKDRDFLKSGVFYEKAYKASNVEVYLENSITAYLHYSFDKTNEKDYEQAIKYCRKVLSLRAGNKDAKEILSDIYYSRGSDFYYRGFTSKAKKDLKKSLQYSVLPEQKQKAEKLLCKVLGKDYKPGISSSFAKENPSPKTIPEVVELMELKIYGQTFEKLPITDRVKKLEQDVFAKNYTQSALVERICRLKRKILPELITPKTE